MYPQKHDPKKTAKAGGRNIPISLKKSVELGRFVKGKKLERAKKELGEVIKLKRPVPFKRFKMHVAHKKGKIAAGRYPVKTAEKLLELIESAENNAENQGLEMKKLIIKNVAASKGFSFRRPRRFEFRGQVKKSTNLSVILEEKQ